jgi:predicted Holliday junction resolvase-like endonuclease
MYIDNNVQINKRFDKTTRTMTLWIYILLIVFLIVLFNLFNLLKNKDKKIDLEFGKNIENRIKNFKYEHEKTQKEIYNLKFNEWKNDNEFEIRRRAIYQSRAAIAETITEELSIINDNFAFNPKDIKFVGRFIDLIIFDGSADETDVSIYFVEILNKSHLNKNDYKAQVEKAINNGNYNFEEINL